MLHRACSTEQGCSWLIQLSLSQKHFPDLKRINQKKFLHRHLLYRYFDLKFFIDSYPNFDEIDHYRQQSMKIFVIWFFQTGSHYVAWGAWNSLYQPGWSQTHRAIYLSLPLSARISVSFIPHSKDFFRNATCMGLKTKLFVILISTSSALVMPLEGERPVLHFHWTFLPSICTLSQVKSLRKSQSLVQLFIHSTT